MDNEMLLKIARLKEKYHSSGFHVIGIFGSYARGDQTKESDIDILYETSDDFYASYPGWDAIPVLEKIEHDFASELGRNVDLANIHALNEIGRKYILPEVIHV